MNGEYQNQDKEKLNTPEVLKGEALVQLIADLYNKAPESIRHCLVESNVVLTLAGLKGLTEFYLYQENGQVHREILLDIDLFNKEIITSQPHLFFQAHPDLLTNQKGDRFTMVSLLNLLTIERLSKKTTLPGFFDYSAKTGMAGWEQWVNKIRQTIQQAKEEGKYSANVNLDIVLTGFARGYPDQAVYDFADAVSKNQTDNLIDSSIPFTGLYGEAEPNYDFYSEHLHDKSIQENILTAGEILESFYDSDWHKQRMPELQQWKSNK